MNDLYTDFFGANSSVNEGDLLSPMLFNICIYELVRDIKNEHCGILLCTDDTILKAGTSQKL